MSKQRFTCKWLLPLYSRTCTVEQWTPHHCGHPTAVDTSHTQMVEYLVSLAWTLCYCGILFGRPSGVHITAVRLWLQFAKDMKSKSRQRLPGWILTVLPINLIKGSWGQFLFILDLFNEVLTPEEQNFWILLIREYRRTEIWAIQPVSRRGAFLLLVPWWHLLTEK